MVLPRDPPTRSPRRSNTKCKHWLPTEPRATPSSRCHGVALKIALPGREARRRAAAALAPAQPSGVSPAAPWGGGAGGAEKGGKKGWEGGGNGLAESFLGSAKTICWLKKY